MGVSKYESSSLIYPDFLCLSRWKTERSASIALGHARHDLFLPEMPQTRQRLLCSRTTGKAPSSRRLEWLSNWRPHRVHVIETEEPTRGSLCTLVRYP